MATLALGLPSRFTSRWRIASCRASHWQSVTAAWHKAHRKRDRAGLGDVAALGASGRLLHVGGQPGPELQGVGVGKTVEGSDLGGDDRGPDLADARHAGEQRNDRGEPCAAGGEDDLAAQSFPVTFGEHDDIDEVGEGLLLDRLQAGRGSPAASAGPRRRRTWGRGCWPR